MHYVYVINERKHVKDNIHKIIIVFDPNIFVSNEVVETRTLDKLHVSELNLTIAFIFVFAWICSI